MSTKIYDAYRFNGSMAELMDMIHEMKQMYLEDCVNYISARKFDTEGLNFSKLRSLLDESHGKWLNPFCLANSVVLYFYKNVKIIHFFNLDAYYMTRIKEKVKSDPRLVDFHYQNQVDPWYEYDNKLTEKEKKAAERNFNYRAKVYNSIFKDCMYGYEVGLTFDFYKSMAILIVWDAINKIQEMKKNNDAL